MTTVTYPLNHWMTPARWRLFALAFTLIVLGSIAISMSYVSHSAIEPDEVSRVSSCREALLNQTRVANQVLDLSQATAAHRLCYEEVNEEDMLVDYSIRKSAYLNQQKQTTVLLWMVVAITLSGVMLAGVQLIAGYRLASAGKAAFDGGGTIDIEKNKLSLKSSVTGLVILAISLVFFYLFVHEVYLIREQGVVGHPPVTSGAGMSGLTPGPFINGGVGAPPAAEPKPAASPVISGATTSPGK
jgi:hypothetical protein